MLYWVERIASHVRVASMIIGQKDSSVCFVLNQEPNMIVQQPLFFSTTHRDNGTRLCWVREVSTAIIIIKKRDNDNAMEPGPGQGITGDNATETFALILAASVLFTTMLCYIHQHPQWYQHHHQPRVTSVSPNYYQLHTNIYTFAHHGSEGRELVPRLF